MPSPRMEIVCPYCSTPQAVAAGSTRKLDCHGCGRAFSSEIAVSNYPTAMPSASPAAPVLLAGRYRLGKEIGRGSCGVVNEARDTHKGNRLVAIKRLLDVHSLDAADRLRREAEIMSRVVHPNILTVLDYGADGGSHYIVMQLIEGQSLRNLIVEGGWTDPRQAVRLMIQVCRAPHHAHAKHNILHRDVKPGNILILPDGESLYLMDFGLAAIKDKDTESAYATLNGTILGTPAYMPPEQARGDLAAICHQSDLYGAAAVLFHLLTGKVPFPGPPPGVFHLIQNNPVPLPSSLRPGLGTRLDEVLVKALAKRPQDRYAHCGQFADALDSWLKSSGVGPTVLGDAKPKTKPRSKQQMAVAVDPRADSTQQGRSLQTKRERASPAQPPAPAPAAAPAPQPPAAEEAPSRQWLWWVLAGVLGLAIVGGITYAAMRPSQQHEPEKPKKGDKGTWGL